MRTTKCKILKKDKKLMQSIFNHYLPFLFSTFTIMLNMINLREIEGPEPVSLYFLHVLYVFMMSILLLNFLIAVFSDSVNNVNQNHSVIYDIQTLSIIHTVENRLQWLFRKWYPHSCKRLFVCERDRIYLPVYHRIFQE